jgi:phage FluMu gp28-like protein
MVSLLDTMTTIAFRQEILCEFISDLLNPFPNIDILCRLKPKDRYDLPTVAGLDLAKTVDYSVLSIMDSRTREEIYVEQFPHIAYTEQVDRVVRLVKQYNIKILAIDATGVGKAVLEILYPKLMDLNIGINPVTFNNQVKVDMINDLILAMEQCKVNFTDDDRGIYQFRRFTRKAVGGTVKYEADNNTHDDFVIARSLAYFASMKVGLFA